MCFEKLINIFPQNLKNVFSRYQYKVWPDITFLFYQYYKMQKRVYVSLLI